MIWIDVIIAIVVVLSAAIGFFRGFLREVLGLATWIVAFFVAFRFAPKVETLLVDWIDMDSARLVVAFAAVFIGVLIVGAILNYFLDLLMNSKAIW